MPSFYIEKESTAEEDEDSQNYCGLFNVVEDDMCSKERRTYSSFNKLTVNHVEYGNGGVMHTTGEISEKYTEAGPTNMTSVKSGLAKFLQKITYAQAIETKRRIKISLSRIEIKGSLGGARKTDINMRKLAFKFI